MGDKTLAWLVCTMAIGCSSGGGGGPPPYDFPDGNFGDDTGTVGFDGGVDTPGGDGGATPTFKQFPVGPQIVDLAVDSSGKLWATAELAPAKVYRFTPTTSTLDAFDVAGGSKALQTQGGLAIDGTGNVWVMTFGSVTKREDPAIALVKLSSSGSVLARYSNSGPSSPDPCSDHPCTQNPFVNQPGSPAIDPSGNIWVCDSGVGGKTYFTKLTPSGALAGYGSVSSTTSAATVLSVAIDSAGNLWGSDPNDNAVVKIGPDGKVLGNFRISDKTDGEEARFAFDRSGNVWIAGAEEAFLPGELIEMSSTGSVLKKIPIPGSGAASEIAIDAAGLIWVIDGGEGNVYAFDDSGSLVRSFPFPNGVMPPTRAIQRSFVIDPSGNLWWTTGQPGLGPDLQGQLIEVVGAATGPQYFPYSGPQYPY